MSAPATDEELRVRRLRAVGVEPWRLRPRVQPTAPAVAPAAEQPSIDAAPVAQTIRRLALRADPSELSDPAIHKMYMSLTLAVEKAGLQAVRVCDVADDPDAAVMVFGAAPLPEGVPAVRVLRADPLAVLHADRDRKRALWERMRALVGNRS